MARQIIVEILGDSSKFKRSLDDAATSGGKFGNVMTGIGQGLGQAAFGVMQQGLNMAVSMLGDAAAAAREDQLSQEMLAQSLKNNIPNWSGSTATVEDFILAQQRLGFADDDLRPAIAQLVGITHDEAEAMRLASLAQDLARAKGIDLAQATDIVTKAAQGNGKALKALGVDIGGATDAAGMLDAIQKNVKGSAEAWAATDEGKLAAAQVRQGEAWEKIGAIINRFTTVIMPILADAFVGVVDVIDTVWTALQPLVDILGNQLSSAISTVQGFLRGLTGGLGQTGTSASTLGKIFERFQAVIKSVFDYVSNYIKMWVGFVTAIWNTFGDDIMGYVKVAFGFIAETIENVLQVIQGIFDVFSAILTGNWDLLWKGLGEIFGGVWDQIQLVLSTAISAIGIVIDTVGKILSGIWDGIWNGMLTVVKTIWDAITAVIKGGINLVIGAINGFIGMINAIQIHIPSIGVGPFSSPAFDWNGLGIGQIPYLHTGGIVPGAPGSDVLAMLQAGERVLPANSSGAIIVQIASFTSNSPRDVDRLADLIAYKLRINGR